jgi:hypothetical protein
MRRYGLSSLNPIDRKTNGSILVSRRGNGKCPQELKRDAMAAWRRFLSCVEMLPANDAALMWRAVGCDGAMTARTSKQIKREIWRQLTRFLH